MSRRRALTAALTAACTALWAYVWMIRRLSMAPGRRRRWEHAEPVFDGPWPDGTRFFNPTTLDAAAPDHWPDPDAPWIWS